MRALVVAPLVALAVTVPVAPAAAAPPDGSPASCVGIRSAVDASSQARDDVAVFFAQEDPAGLTSTGQYYVPVARAHAGSYRACTALTPPLMPPAHP